MDNATLMRSYYAAYNSEDETQLAPLLAEDVVLISAAVEQHGRDAYLATYRSMIGKFRDRLTPVRITVLPDGAIVHLEDQLKARSDIPNFLGRAVAKDENLLLMLTGHYTIQAGKITRIKVSIDT